MAMWNPWRGCHKYSDGCRFCYIHKGDAKRNIDTNKIVKTDNFYAPIKKNTKGEYIMKSGQTVYLCFSSDFLVEDADIWRDECWDMIRERKDLHFLFLTKRISRLKDCLPYDWVLSIREQCIRKNVHFEFRQCGTNFIKDNKKYTLKVRDLCSQAKKANINV